jgi:hypothetical protein
MALCDRSSKGFQKKLFDLQKKHVYWILLLVDHRYVRKFPLDIDQDVSGYSFVRPFCKDASRHAMLHRTSKVLLKTVIRMLTSGKRLVLYSIMTVAYWYTH